MANENVEMKLGEVFQELRKKEELSSSDFKDCGISRQLLSSFEQGKSRLSLGKLISALKILGLSLDEYFDVVNCSVHYPRYGEVFRELREQREVDADAFSALGISPLELELFESGKIMLDVDKLESAIEMMRVTLSDFEALINRGQASYVDENLEALDRAVMAGDTDSIKEIYKTAKENKAYLLVALAAKAEFTALDESEQEIVNSYFFGLDDFSFSDLSAFVHMIQYVTTDTLIPILNDLLRDQSTYKFVYRRNVFRALILSVYALLKRGSSETAQSVLQKSRKLITLKGIYERLLYKFTQGYYEFVVNQDESGLEMMKEIIGFLDFLDEKTVKNWLTAKMEYAKNQQK